MQNHLWAVNKVKLQQSYAALEKKKKLDSRVEITEETVKAEYISRAGLIREEKDFINAPEAPKNVPIKNKTVEELKELAGELGADISECEDKKQLVKVVEVAQATARAKAAKEADRTK